MIIKEAKYEDCKCCGSRKRVSEESYGCDSCKKLIDDLLQSGNTKFNDYLELVVFSHEREAERLQFCSWKCVFKKLKTIKTDNFVSLPYLTYEKTEKGQTVQDFWKAIKEFK